MSGFLRNFLFSTGMALFAFNLVASFDDFLNYSRLLARLTREWRAHVHTLWDWMLHILSLPPIPELAEPFAFGVSFLVIAVSAVPAVWSVDRERIREVTTFVGQANFSGDLKTLVRQLSKLPSGVLNETLSVIAQVSLLVVAALGAFSHVPDLEAWFPPVAFIVSLLLHIGLMAVALCLAILAVIAVQASIVPVAVRRLNAEVKEILLAAELDDNTSDGIAIRDTLLKEMQRALGGEYSSGVTLNRIVGTVTVRCYGTMFLVAAILLGDRLILAAEVAGLVD